jgi:hypothetical protein
MQETAIVAFEESCHEVCIGADESDFEAVEDGIVSDSAGGHDVAIRQLLSGQMSSQGQKESLPDGMDESQLPELYALAQLMSIQDALAAQEVHIDVEELPEIETIAQLTRQALNDGSYIVLIQVPDEAMLMVVLTVHAKSVTLRVLCFSDNLNGRVSLRVMHGLACEWSRALQSMICILRKGHSVKVFRVGRKGDSNN